MTSGELLEPRSKAVESPTGKTAAWFLAIMFLGYFAFTADRTVLSAMLQPLSASLGISKTVSFGIAQTSWLAAAQFMGVLAFVLVSGYLSDRYGHRRVILVGLAVFTAFTWLIGTAGNFQEAFVYRLLSGFGEGLFWPAAMSAVANYFGRSKGLALGIFYAGFDLGGAAGNTIGSIAFTLTSDWRTAFFVAPLLGIPVLAGVFTSKKTFSEAVTKTGTLSIGRDALALLLRRRVSAILAFAFLATWASVWQVAYLPYYYRSVFETSVAQSGLTAAAVLIAGMIGKTVFGRLSDSVRRDRLIIGLSAVVVVLYGVFFAASDLGLAIITAVAAGFFSSAIFPVMQALASDSSEGRTGTVLGLTTTFQSVAAVIGVLLPGALLPLGVRWAFTLGAMVPALAMVLASFLLRESRESGNSGLGRNNL
ncbi:MAG TPA: MFS transporter [Nitrososphaerales archaeon]|nr:MFS transporter [Nitrososphaerales archaeon]